MRGVDQFPEAGISGKFLILGARQLGTEGKILEGVFVEDPVNHQAGGFLFEVDPVVPGPVGEEPGLGVGTGSEREIPTQPGVGQRADLEVSGSGTGPGRGLELPLGGGGEG